MKKFIVIILCMLSTYESLGQSFLKDQKHLKGNAKRRARKELLKSVTHEGWMSKFEAHALNGTLKPIPVLSFTISPEAVKYDSTKKIAEYLLPNSYFPIEFAILMKKGKFYATLNCYNNVNYLSCEVCNYDDEIEEKDNYYSYEIKKALAQISKRKYSLLFTVKYVRGCIWFVENGNIFIFETKERKFYHPDDFIKTHCSAQVIRGIALGKPARFCN
jgi:hypothetical protein